jgi:hypothetical protein
MEKHQTVHKSVVVCILLLFVTTVVSSHLSGAITNLSKDTVLVEMTTEAWSPKGCQCSSLRLTQEQYQSFEQYLVTFRARLNQTKTRSEVASLFKEAVVQLEAYGLLPKGMSIDQAQKLTAGWYQKQSASPAQKQVLLSLLPTHDGTSDYLCMLAGRTNHTSFENVGSVLFNSLSQSTNGTAISGICSLLYRFLLIRCSNNPFSFLNRMNLGYQSVYPNATHYASGWINAVGIVGVDEFEGDHLQGIVSVEGTQFSPEPPTVYKQCPAIVGFIGIKIGFGTMLPNFWEGKEFFYLGSALWMDVSS